MSKYQYHDPKFFHESYRSQNDWGHCCEIVPYLDFENPESNGLAGEDYTDEMWNNIPEGHAKSGVPNGLRLLLDIESYEYDSSSMGSVGVKVATIGSFFIFLLIVNQLATNLNS